MYSIISEASKNLHDKDSAVELRKKYLNSLGITKVAFDTRRINQETEYNPRRGLQYYQRSQPFISDDVSEKVKKFLKLKNAVDMIKEDYLGSPQWLDSYCRILNATIDRTLRVEQKDFDISGMQLDYLQELLYLRYRLSMADLDKMNELELKRAILAKDEKLQNITIYSTYDNIGFNKNNMNQGLAPVMAAPPPDPLINKLLGDVKATQANKDVERTITISVRDKINEEQKKEG